MNFENPKALAQAMASDAELRKKIINLIMETDTRFTQGLDEIFAWWVQARSVSTKGMDGNQVSKALDLFYKKSRISGGEYIKMQG